MKKKSTSKVLVTGANGFLGGHVVRELLQKGREVIALSRSAGNESEDGRLQEIKASVLDGKRLQSAMKGCSEVIHLAGMVSRDPRAASEMEKLHVDGTRRVFEGAARAGVKRIVYLSSSGTIAVSNDRHHVATEKDPYPERLTKDWPYYVSKIRAEQEALRLAKKLKIEIIVLNPSLLLGPGDERLSSTGDVLKFLRGKIPAIPSGGLSFVDVRDVAKVTANALQKGRSGERYLLGAANWDFKKFFTRLGELSACPVPRFKAPDLISFYVAKLSAPVLRKCRLEPLIDPVSVRMSQLFWYCDSGKAKRELSFSPRQPSETLWDTIEDLRQRRLA